MDFVIENAVLNDDGTLWIQIPEEDTVMDYKTLSQIDRVILSSGIWYREYYMSEDE